MDDFLRGMIDELMGKPERMTAGIPLPTQGAAMPWGPAATVPGYTPALAEQGRQAMGLPAPVVAVAPAPPPPPQITQEQPTTPAPPPVNLAPPGPSMAPGWQNSPATDPWIQQMKQQRPTPLPPPPPQRAAQRFFEENTQLPTGIPPPTPEEQATQEAAEDRGHLAWQAAWQAAVQRAERALEPTAAAGRNRIANPDDPATVQAYEAANQEYETAQADVERLLGIGQERGWLGPDLFDQAVSLGFDAIDKPRQVVVSELGDAAIRYVSGETGDELIDFPDWLTEFAGSAGTDDFNEWYRDPANAQRIQYAATNGFQANENAPRFTGGRAVWELFVNSLPWGKKAFYDAIYDPSNVVAGAGSLGRGIKAGVKAAELVGPGGRALTGLGSILAAPDAVLARTADAVIPAILKGAGKGLTQIPVLGPWLQHATDMSPRAYLEQKLDDLVSSIHRARATQDATQALATQPATTPATVGTLPNPATLVPAGQAVSQAVPPAPTPAPPSAPLPAPTSLVPPGSRAMGPMPQAPPPAREPVTVGTVASIHRYPNQGPIPPDPVTIYGPRGETLTTIGPPAETAPATPGRNWIDPALPQQQTPVPTTIRGTLDSIRQTDPAGAERWVAAWERDIAAPYRENPTGGAAPRGSARDPLAHVTFVVTSEGDLVASFPTASLTPYRPAGPLDWDSIQSMVETAVFGTPEEAIAVRQWFRQHPSQTFGPPLDRGTGQPATPRAGREIADELKYLRAVHETFVGDRTFGAAPATPEPTAAAETSLVSPEVRADAQAFQEAGPHPRRGELTAAKAKGAAGSQRIMLGAEPTRFAVVKGKAEGGAKSYRTWYVAVIGEDGKWEHLPGYRATTKEAARKDAIDRAGQALDDAGEETLVAGDLVTRGITTRREVTAAAAADPTATFGRTPGGIGWGDAPLPTGPFGPNFPAGRTIQAGAYYAVENATTGRWTIVSDLGNGRALQQPRHAADPIPTSLDEALAEIDRLTVTKKGLWGGPTKPLPPNAGVETTVAGPAYRMPGMEEAGDPQLTLAAQEIGDEGPVLTPEQQRQAEVDAGQADMFGTPPSAVVPTRANQGFGAATGSEVFTAPRQLQSGERVIYVGSSADDTPVRIIERTRDGRRGYAVEYAQPAASADSPSMRNEPVYYEWYESGMAGVRTATNIADPNDLMGIARSVLGNVDRTRQQAISEGRRPLGAIRADDDVQRAADFAAEDEMASYPDVIETPAAAVAPTGRAVPGEASLLVDQIAVRPEDALTEYRRVPRSAIRLRPEEYQMRSAPYAESSVTNIVETYRRDPAAFKRVFHPIEVRANPDGTYTVLSGHSRFEAANRLDLPEVPIRLIDGTDAEIEEAARLSNTLGTQLKPTENGANLVRLMELTGKSIDQVAKDTKISLTQAQRFIDVTFLPETLKAAVDKAPTKLDTFATIGAAVRDGTLGSEEAFIYFRDFVSPNDWGVTSLQDNLATIRRLKQGTTEQVGLFAGMDLGDTGFAATMATASELTNVRRALIAARRDLAASLRRREKGIISVSDEWVAETKAAIPALDRRIVDLEADLGLRGADGTTYTPSGREIGFLPMGKAARMANQAWAQRQASQAVAAATVARTTAQAMPPGLARPLPLAADVVDTLTTRFTAHPTLAGDTYEDVLTGILTTQTRRPTTLYTATEHELAEAIQAFRREMKQEVGFREAGAIARVFDTLSGAYSEWALLLPHKLPRYLISNIVLGNSVQTALGGHTRALGRMNDPRHVRALMDYARHGGDPLNSPTGQLFLDIGAGGYHPKLTSDGMMAATMGKGESNLRRIMNKAPGVKAGFAIPRFRPVAAAREFSNGFEWAARTGLAGYKTQETLMQSVKPFREQAAKYAARHFPAIPEGDLRANLVDLGWRTDAVTVRGRMEQLARLHGLTDADAIRFGDRIGKDWANVVSRSIKAGVDTTDSTLFSYQYRNIDTWVKRIAPFHYWMSRAIPWYAQQGLRHPGLAAAYYRAWQSTEHYADEQGWPDSMKGFVKLWGGPGGLMMLFNPMAAVGLLDVFIDQSGGYTPENLSLIGKLVNQTGQYGFGLLPWWSAALNFSGLMGDSIIGLDPIGLFQERKLFGGLVSLGRAKGWIEGDPLAKPFEQRMRDWRAAWSTITAGVIPGAHAIPATDASAYPREIVANTMLDAYLDEQGISREAFTALGMAPEGSEERERYDAILEEMLAEQETEGPRYMQAAEQFAEANLGLGGFWNFVGTYLLSGPKRLRQAGQMVRGEEAYAAGFPGTTPAGSVQGLRLPLTDPYQDGRVSGNELAFLRQWYETYGTPYEAGDLERLQATVRREKEFSEWTPESAPLAVAQSQYQVLGAGRTQDRAQVDMWAGIAFGDLTQNVTVNGVRYTPEQIAALPQETRFAFADAWLLEHDRDGSAQHLRDERDLFEETHPEYALYKDWAADVRRAWGQYGDAGLALYRTELSRQNPNAKRYFDEATHQIIAQHPGWTPSQIQEELNRRTLSIAAYEAVKGIQHKYADPLPLDTGSGDPVYPPGYSPSSDGGGDGGGESRWAARATTAIAETEAWLTTVNRVISGAYGGDIDYRNLPPPLQQSLDITLQQGGLTPPADAWIFWQFQAWSEQQRRLGMNGSVEAYVLATRDGPLEEERRQTTYVPGMGSLVGASGGSSGARWDPGALVDRSPW